MILSRNEELNYVEEMVDLMSEGMSLRDASDIVKDSIRNDVDGLIWEQADSEDEDFDAILNEILEEIEEEADSEFEDLEYSGGDSWKLNGISQNDFI